MDEAKAHDRLTDWASRLALPLLALLPFLFHWRLFALNPLDRGSFPHGDFSVQFYAFAHYQAERLLAGQLPLWSDGAFSGFPFLADIQSASLYPPRLLMILLAAPWGYPYAALEVEAVLHFSLAAVFTFLLGRRLFGHAGISFLVALTFTFSGYLTSYPGQQLAILESAVWLPLAVLAAEEGLRRPRPLNRWTLLCSLALALSALAGHPQTVMLVVYVVVAFALWRGGWKRGLTFLAPSLALAGGLAAAQLLPSAQYTLLSSRAGSGYEEIAAGLNVQDLVQVLFPGSVSGQSPFYLGMLPLLLAGAALVLAPGGAVRFWFVAALVALLLSFGDQAYLHSLFYLIAPGWRLFRGQERLALLVAFPVSLLVGYGLQALICPSNDACRRAYVRGSAALPAGLGLSATAFFFGLIAQGWTSGSGFYWLLGSAVFVAIAATLGWGLLRWWTTGPRSPLLFYGLAAAIIVFDLFTVGWRLNFSEDPAQAREAAPLEVAAMQADAGGRPFRVFNEFRLDGNYGVQFGLDDIWGASPLRLARYEELLARLPWERAWPLLNVRYVVTWRRELPLPSTVIFERAVGSETTLVHRINEAYPRAWLVTEAEIVSPAAAPSRLAAADLDLQRVTLLEEAPPLSLQGGVPGTVRWRTREPERLLLDVDAESSALVILSEVNYPGWRAWVDGEATPVLTADHVLRAVPVTAGEHSVELRFVPTLWLAGAIVSVLAWIGLGIGLVLTRER